MRPLASRFSIPGVLLAGMPVGPYGCQWRPPSTEVACHNCPQADTLAMERAASARVTVGAVSPHQLERELRADLTLSLHSCSTCATSCTYTVIEESN